MKILLILLLVLFSATAVYAGWITLRDTSLIPLGTIENPIYISLQ
jgi:hypothetical protein